MSVDRGFSIDDHLSIDYLNCIIKDFKLQHKVCIRAIFIKILLQGSTIKEASKTARYCKTNWIKMVKQNIIKKVNSGLIPKFDGDKPGKLSDKQKTKLKSI